MQGMGWTLALAAVLPAGLAAQAVEATDQNDRAAHAFMSAVDLGEVQQSMLATERATNAEVRAYAQQMINDHHNALHTREMLMQTERSGLMPAMNHGAQGQGGNAQAGAHAGHGNAAGGQDSAHAGHGNAAAGGQASGQGQGGAHAGHGNMAGGQGAAHMPPPEMIAELENVLRNHPMSRPVVEANARNLGVLQGVTGPQFDPTYMDAQIGAHRYALGQVDRMITQGGVTDEMMATMRSMRTAIAQHLEQAQAIRARL
jgi:predicted outer membrane protein